MPKASTKSPFATEAMVALPPGLRKIVLESVVTVSIVPSKLRIVIVVPETLVTWPATVAGTIWIVPASIWLCAERQGSGGEHDGADPNVGGRDRVPDLACTWSKRGVHGDVQAARFQR